MSDLPNFFLLYTFENLLSFTVNEVSYLYYLECGFFLISNR